MTIQPDTEYIFTKSGNRVKTIEPTDYAGKGGWRVRRVDGASAGKEMIVPGTALSLEEPETV